jgi:hypothetical protein
MRAAARELELMAAADESHRKREYERLAARMRHLADDACAFRAHSVSDFDLIRSAIPM